MELPQPTTAVNGPSTSNMAGHVVSCLDRLELIRRANRDRALRPESLAVLIELAGHVNSDTGTAWPSQETIGQRLGMAQPNVSRALSQLEECGYLTRERHHRHTVYRLTAPPSHITPDMSDISPTICDDISPTIYKPGKSNPVTEPGKTDYPSGNPGGAPKARRAREEWPPPRPDTGYLPKDWQPSEQLILKAMTELRLTREQVLHQTRRFHDTKRSQRARSGDWPAAWWLWMDDVGPTGSQRWRVEPRGGQTYAEHRVMVDNVDRQRDTVVPLNGGWR